VCVSQRTRVPFDSDEKIKQRKKLFFDCRQTALKKKAKKNKKQKFVSFKKKKNLFHPKIILTQLKKRKVLWYKNLLFRSKRATNA